MKLTTVIYSIFPIIGNKASNKALKAKIENADSDDPTLDTPRKTSSNPEAITEEILKGRYESALKTKDKLEDKAKATIVCVTVSVSLIMGASGLLNTVASKYVFSLVAHWVSYILLLYAVLSMIFAAIMDVKVLADENTVYTLPIGDSGERKLNAYDLCVGKNDTQNLIRNNYVFSAYESIRNALICLFIILAFAVLPIQNIVSPEKKNMEGKAGRDYSYAESTIKTLEQHNVDTIKNIVETALPSMNVEDGKIYSIADSENSLFVRFLVNEEDINILSIDDISWGQ